MNEFMEKYLAEVDRRLRRLPVGERLDIVNELRSEMAELSAAGLAPEQIEQRLGSARSLAAGYLGEAIAKSPRFSWRKLGLLAAFYSYAGLGGVIVLPVTSICAAAFIICGAACPLPEALGRDVERGRVTAMNLSDLPFTGRGPRRCRRCGYETGEDFDFCPRCGTRF